MIVADVGAGTGRSYPFRPRAPLDAENIFIDVEPPVPRVRHYGHWVVADAQRLPLRRSSLDAVVAGHLLEHLDDPDAFHRGCRLVLKRGGRLWLVLPNFLSVNARADPGHRRVYSVLTVISMLKRHGFTIHFDFRAGSLLPSPLRKPLSLLINLFAEEIRVVGERK